MARSGEVTDIEMWFTCMRSSFVIDISILDFCVAHLFSCLEYWCSDCSDCCFDLIGPERAEGGLRKHCCYDIRQLVRARVASFCQIVSELDTRLEFISRNIRKTIFLLLKLGIYLCG